MSVNAPCREGITTETISTWSDGGLNTSDATHLREHIPTCAACQATYNAYRDLDTLIRAQRAPAALPTDVATILAGRPANRQRRAESPQRPQRSRRTIPRAVWGGIGAALAAAVLIVAFAQVFTHLRPLTPTATVTPRGTATPGATATATIMTAPMIPFQQAHLPSAYHSSEGGGGAPGPVWDAAISPVNGNEAWVCGVNSDGTFTLWQSLDSMATWKFVATLTPPHQTAQIESCVTELDQGDENALAVDLTWSNGNGPDPNSSDITYYSANNGATWTKLTGNISVYDITTAGSTTYATLFDHTTNHASAIVSNDRLATWRTLTPPPGASGEMTLAANLLPSGAIDVLWQDWQDPNGQSYQSSDGGATWRALGLLQGHKAQLVATLWQASLSQWKLCAFVNQTSSNETLPPFGCTTDLGATWTMVQQPTSTFECNECGPGVGPWSGLEPCMAYQMTGDGTLYDVCGNDPQDTSNPSSSVLIRYSPSSQTWTVVGGLPVPYSSPVVITLTGQVWLQDSAHEKIYYLEQIP